MLVAEIHGKRNSAIQNDEDYLTSAVFGHLRFVKDGHFWTKFFEQAEAVDGSNLADHLRLHGACVPVSTEVQIVFWPYYARYGEPDLILSYKADSGRLVKILIEVKLRSGKSRVGENDQLVSYYDLLQDKHAIPELQNEDSFRALIYLTERYAMSDLKDSVILASDALAGHRMFAMQWQAALHAVEECSKGDSLLCEIAVFLKRRGLEAFRGMRKSEDAFGWLEARGFYAEAYFQLMPDIPDIQTRRLF